jgi:superkiller protein 3
VRLDPDLKSAPESLAEALLAVGDAQAALAAYEAGARANPNGEQNPAVLANIYGALGRYEEALAANDEVIRNCKVLDITSCWHFEARGKILKKLGRYEEAIAAWDKAAELAPFRPYSFKWRSELKFRLGRYGEALADISRSLELNPGDLSALTWIAPVEARACPDPAFREGLLRLADAAVARPGAPAAAWTARGRLKAELLGPAEALPDLAAAAAKEDAGHFGRYLHALACLDSGDLPAYRGACRDLLTRFANAAPEAAVFAAWTCALAPNAVDDYAPAVAAARRAAEASPKDADAAKTHAALLYRSGRFDEAAGGLEAVLAMPKIDATHAAYARFFLAMARARLGDVESARASFDEAARWTDAATATPEAQAAANLTWNRAATLALLRREAAALLAPVEAPSVR